MFSTIYILWLRQIKRYFRSKARLLGSLGQPILFLVALGYGFGPVYAQAGQGDFIQFLAPGVIAMSILFSAVFNGIELIWDKQFGFIKETMVAPVSRFSIMLGRTIGGATTAVAQGLIVFIIAQFFGYDFSAWATFSLAILIMFMIATVFTALGVVIASFLEDMQGFQLIMNFLVMPIFFLSGTIFPISGLSGAISVVVHFNPLSYGVDALRLALGSAGVFHLAFSMSILTVFMLTLLIAGALSFSRMKI